MEEVIIKEKLKGIFPKEEIDLINFTKINLKKDILSSIFEILSKNREKYAQFYTHKELINFILDNVPLKEDSLVLDPACGAGAFLIEVLARNKNNSNNVFGIDIDPLAIKLCDLNAELNTERKLKNLFNKNTLKNSELGEVLEKNKFDLIVGNPPFKNLKKDNIEYDIKDPIFKEVSSGSVNSATLMIAKSFELLKEGGYLGFVLPKNLIRVESFSKLRSFILDNFCIKTLLDIDHHFKDVRGDQIILILQKEKSENVRANNRVRIIPYKKGAGFELENSYLIDQKDFQKYSFYPLFYNQKVKKLADKLLNIDIRLKDITNNQIFRGVSISSNHKAISKDNKPNSIVCYRGDSIKRFGIKYPLYLDINELNSSEKNKVNRLQEEKVIIQNICSKEGGIFATTSNQDELSLDTVTNIILKNKDYHKFIIGLLNSKISNFFMTFIIYLNSNFTMHTDRIYLGKIPVRVPEKKQLAEINNFVEKLLQIKEKYSPEFFEVYNQLNNYLYKLYDLNNEEILIIEDSLRRVMSKKQNG